MITRKDITLEARYLYMEHQKEEDWPYVEMMYQAYSIVLECLQRMEGGYFSDEYVISKLNTIAAFLPSLKPNPFTRNKTSDTGDK